MELTYLETIERMVGYVRRQTFQTGKRKARYWSRGPGLVILGVV